MELFAGDSEGFVAWVGERTKGLAHANDFAIRDADLETVIQFMQAKARRTRPFSAPDPSAASKRMNRDATLRFTSENGLQP
jgi:hypothetical protein